MPDTELLEIHCTPMERLDESTFDRVGGDFQDVGNILASMLVAVNQGREAGVSSDRNYMKLARAIRSRAPEAGSFAKAADLVAAAVSKAVPEGAVLPAALTGAVARETMLRVYDIASLGGVPKDYAWRPKTGAMIVPHSGKSVAGLVQGIGHVGNKAARDAYENAGVEYGFVLVDKIIAAESTAQGAVDELVKHREKMTACVKDAGVKARETKTADLFLAQAVKALNSAIAAIKAGDNGPDGAALDELQDVKEAVAAATAMLAPVE